MFRRRAPPGKLEGLFTGGSGGGCISGTLRLAKDLGPNDFVVALLPDTGTRYLSKVYNDLWMHERGYVDAATAITAAEVVNAKHAAGKVRELVIARPYQTVFHALKTMQEQDISQIPVFEENFPIGTIYEDQILTLALQGRIFAARRPRSHEQAFAAGAKTAPSSASPTSSATRIPRSLSTWKCAFRDPHQVRFDEHCRQPHGTKTLSAFPARNFQ